MHCKKVRNLLFRLLDDELPEFLKTAVNDHINQCQACQQEKELLVKSWQMLDGYETHKLKENFTPNLMRKIRSEKAEIIKVKFQFPWFRLGRLAPVLALMFVMAFSLYIYKQNSKENVMLPPQNEVATISDEDIIENLDILEDLELLEDITFLSELDVIENLDEATLSS